MNKKKLSEKYFRLLSLLSVFVVILLFMPVSVNAEAAVKPAPNETKITLSTTAKPYHITFKGLADKASVTYTSSKSSVASVKNGVITPKKAGKTTVTCKISQNSKKYTCKISVTVKDYNKGFKKKINDMVVEKPNYKLNEEVITSQKEFDKKINSMSQKYSLYTIAVNSLDFLRPEQYYLDKNPAIASMEYSSITKYTNCYGISIKAHKISNLSTFDPDRYNISETNIVQSLSSGKTDNMNKNELTVYNYINKIAKKLEGKTDYDTVKAIHDYLVLNIAYDNTLQKFSVYEALWEKTCVCSGYAKTFYMLCMASGIDAVIVSGQGKKESHAWNKVRIGNQWFNVDVTWDDPTPDTPGKVRYEYFMITDEDMRRDHTWDNTGYGVADSKKYGILYQELAKMTTFESVKAYNNWLSKTLPDTEAAILEAKASGSKQKSYEYNLFIYDGSSECYDTTNEYLRSSNGRGFGYSLKCEVIGSFGIKIYFKIYK